MKKIIFCLALSIFAVISASDSHAQGRGSFAAVPVPGQPVPTPTAPTPTPAAPQIPGAPRPATPTSPAAPGAKPEEQLRIVPDQATNSLIIYSTVQEFQNIKNILKDLDIIPRQVLMDVLVAEVTLSDTSSFGVEYELFKLQNPTIFGQMFNSQAALRNLGVPGVGFSSISPQSATGLAQFGAGASGVIGRGNSVQAFITALATDSRIKVLSAPTVLATDNKPARIQVGNEIPVLTGQTSTFISGGTNPSPLTSNSIQYRNTGVILTIIPQVNSQGLVHLQVKQEVSDVGQDNFGSTGSPSFSTRDAETTAVVQDGESLAIGGLISEKKQRSRSGIPYLMDLPFLGRFFSTTRDTSDRTELVMLITPHVVRNREEGRDATEEFKSRLSNVKDELERLGRERAKERARRLSEPDDFKLDRKPSLPPAAPVAPNPQTPVPAPSRAPVVPTPPLAPANSPAVPAPQVLLLAPRSKSGADPVNQDPTEPESASAFQVALEPQETAAAFSGEPNAVPTALLSTVKITTGPDALPVQFKPQRQKTQPTWLVQVASYARGQDAEVFASKLRSRGYDANVVNAEVAGRTWSRVQVGRLATQKEARELQRNLRVNEKIEQSFIAISY